MAHEARNLVFDDQKFCIAKRLPNRQILVDNIKSHGGKIVELEKNANFIVVDVYNRPVAANAAFVQASYIFDCIKQGCLLPSGDFSPVRAVKGRPKGWRREYTPADDQAMVDWVLAQEAKGKRLGGNEIWRAFGDTNPNHTWQSWRDRWIKQGSHLRHFYRPSAVVAPSNINDYDSSETSASQHGTTTESAPYRFLQLPGSTQPLPNHDPGQNAQFSVPRSTAPIRSASDSVAPPHPASSPSTIASQPSSMDQRSYFRKPAGVIGRARFSREDDKLLIDFVQQKMLLGEKVSGNQIYQELAAQHPHHSYHSWRHRYLNNILAQLSRESPQAPSAATVLATTLVNKTTIPSGHVHVGSNQSSLTQSNLRRQEHEVQETSRPARLAVTSLLRSEDSAKPEHDFAPEQPTMWPAVNKKIQGESAVKDTKKDARPDAMMSPPAEQAKIPEAAPEDEETVVEDTGKDANAFRPIVVSSQQEHATGETRGDEEQMQGNSQVQEVENTLCPAEVPSIYTEFAGAEVEKDDEKLNLEAYHKLSEEEKFNSYWKLFREVRHCEFKEPFQIEDRSVTPWQLWTVARQNNLDHDRRKWDVICHALKLDCTNWRQLEIEVRRKYERYMLSFERSWGSFDQGLQRNINLAPSWPISRYFPNLSVEGSDKFDDKQMDEGVGRRQRHDTEMHDQSQDTPDCPGFQDEFAGRSESHQQAAGPEGVVISSDSDEDISTLEPLPPEFARPHKRPLQRAISPAPTSSVRKRLFTLHAEIADSPTRRPSAEPAMARTVSNLDPS